MKNKFAPLKLLLLLIASLFFTSAYAEEQETQLSEQQEEAQPSNIQELKAAIAELIEEKDVPAAGIAMIDETGPVWIGAFGKANLENNIDADENSLFRIGSTSKMFVALSVLKLVEQGQISLSDKLSDLAPDIVFENQWSDTDPIRVVHLLEHTTGWDDIHLPEYAHNDPTPATLKQGLDFHPHSRISRWKPGSRMSYCNAGPPVAAYIVEKITGQNFEEYVQENFFDPMGMSTATYLLNNDVKNKGVTLYANGNQPQDYWHIMVRPSGSINASAMDMSKLLQFYVNRGSVTGEQLISHASLVRMETAETTNAAKVGQESGYGLNNYSSPHESWVYREHNGGVNGGLTELAYLPSANLGHVIMINSGDGSAFRAISKLIRNYETRNLSAVTVNNDIEVTSEHKKIEGLYYPINSRQDLSYFIDRIANLQRLRFDGNKLVRKGVLGGEPVYYYPVSTDLYQSELTGLISLSKAIDPLAGEVVHANNTVLLPTSSIAAYTQLIVGGLWAFVMLSSVLFVLVWGIRKFRGQIPAGATVKIRLWPLLASLSIMLLVFLFIQGSSNPFDAFGAPSVFSVGIMLSTFSFALFSVLGVYTSIKERTTKMNRGTYWYSTVSSFVHLIVAVYLLSFGIIGLTLWA